MVIMTGSPGDLVDRGGRRGDCTAACGTGYMYRLFVWNWYCVTYIVLCNDHGSFYIILYILLMNIITVQVFVRPMRVVVGLHCSEGRWQEKKDQWLNLNSGHIPLHRDSAVWGIDPSHNPLSPIALCTGNGCAVICNHLKTRTSRLEYHYWDG